MLGPESNHMGALLSLKYIPYAYTDPLGTFVAQPFAFNKPLDVRKQIKYKL